jgi:hypothetical protein
MNKKLMVKRYWLFPISGLESVLDLRSADKRGKLLKHHAKYIL